MKRILCIVLVLLFASVCEAQQIMVMKKKSAGATCSAATDEVGDRTDYTAQGYGSSTENELMCVLYTADCSGSLAYGLLATNENDDNIKVAVFADDGDSVPDSGDALVTDSIWADAESSGHGGGWLQTTNKLGGSVTQGNSYWVCTVPNSAFNVARISTGGTRTRYYQAIAGSYASPPSNLDGSWSTFGSSERSVYVEIE